MLEETSFDDYLNATYEAFVIMGITVLPADILKECDPIAYRIYSKDWQESE